MANTKNSARNHQAPASRSRISGDSRIASKLYPGGSAKKGKTDTQRWSIVDASTTSNRAIPMRAGTTHSQSLRRCSPVFGSRGVSSRSLRLTVAQPRSPSSWRTMIMERTNSQIKPNASNTTLVTPEPSGSDRKSGATSGKTIQLKIAIGRVAAAQMPRILARLYRSFVPTAFYDAFVVIFVISFCFGAKSKSSCRCLSIGYLLSLGLVEEYSSKNATTSDRILSSCPSNMWPPLSIVTSLEPGILSAADCAFL